MIAWGADKSIWRQNGAEGLGLETVYDWLTVAIFAGLVVLFLQRSVGDRPPGDSMLQYLAASAGCAVANYFGNEAVAGRGLAYHLLAGAVIVGTLAYIHIALRPLDKPVD
jgi:hypothetical protein